MSIAPINMSAVIDQMQDVSKLAQNQSPSSKRINGSAFSSALAESLQKISDAQNAANLQAQHFELGVPGISLNDVMIDLQKANLSFQMGVQVRNKVIAAYQQIASMPL